MESEDSLPRSQEPAIGPCLKPDESNPHPDTQFITHCNIILPSSHGYSKFCDYNFVRITHLPPMRATCLTYAILLDYVPYTILFIEIKPSPVWWPGNKNSPTVTHACRKRRLKWVATLPPGDINTEAWSSEMGVGRGAKNSTL
jgi:hypothetical protein